jgi:hypothetical protein
LPSFLEIPMLLRTASAKAEFIQWLAAVPIPDSAKRKLAQLWTANTGGTLTNVDHMAIMARPLTGKAS